MLDRAKYQVRLITTSEGFVSSLKPSIAIRHDVIIIHDDGEDGDDGEIADGEIANFFFL